MPKILTARRREDERERARLYLKSRLMLPTIPLGMVTLLAGYADVVLMWIQDQLTPRALLARPAVCAGDVRRGDRFPGRDQPVLSRPRGGLCSDLSPLGRLL